MARGGWTRVSRQTIALWARVAFGVLVLAVVIDLDPQTRGWRADHGHVTLGRVVATHSHPWDTADATQAADASSAAVGFTDPDAGGGLAIAMPAASPLVQSLRGVTVEVALPLLVLPSHRVIVPTPPPRG